MISDNLESKKKRALAIMKGLRKAIPDPTIELHFKNPMQLLASTILSAQCTDKRVNMVTPALFKKYKTAKDFARANVKTFEKEIHSTGFFRAKTKSIIGSAKEIEKRFGGKVPGRMEDLLTLPGVARKTANVVLGNAFDIPQITSNRFNIFLRQPRAGHGHRFNKGNGDDCLHQARHGDNLRSAENHTIFKVGKRLPLRQDDIVLPK